VNFCPPVMMMVVASGRAAARCEVGWTGSFSFLFPFVCLVDLTSIYGVRVRSSPPPLCLVEHTYAVSL